MIFRDDRAVSPVIGVMLMIVVTVIIAAIVSSFAGGMGSDERKVPSAAFDVTPNLKDNGTIEFHHRGGSVIDINATVVQLEYDSRTLALSNDDTATGFTSPYLTELGSGADGYIDAGDRFVLTADKMTEDRDLVFQPESMGATNFTIEYNKPVSYTILDKGSGKAIQTGGFMLR
ncbi:type IV pilin N-terminal domain-containing protein [Methanoculleus sp. UBA331]